MSFFTLLHEWLPVFEPMTQIWHHPAILFQIFQFEPNIATPKVLHARQCCWLWSLRFSSSKIWRDVSGWVKPNGVYRCTCYTRKSKWIELWPHEWPVHKYFTRFFTGFSTSQIVQDISYQQYLEQKSVGSLGRKCRPLLQDTKFMAYEIITKKMKYFFHPMCWNDHCWIIICS